ncbi:MAG: flagellar biosynthetic protein FliO [Trichlorobacter sp.]|jgi:flagellar protein FliO/FliZ|nr:flagellar biosynthetic protein FliO [Trichlorobacter sp.]
MQPALAQGDGALPATTIDNFSLLSSLLQMSAALLLVLGLILLVYYLANKLFNRVPSLRPGGRYVRVIEIRQLEPRKALILVEVAGEYLLLSSSENGLNLIKQVPLLEEGEIIDEAASKTSFSSILKRLKKDS